MNPRTASSASAALLLGLFGVAYHWRPRLEEN